ncbi:hypothetical protein MMA231_04009 (plasmid) [Asticcacaulis sp. MM231]|jgi:hypothetical protein|uniref:hypothetical protein n=1 Tax=Asticcacaulis sp. MM231 TaxID=3157666 RepID=UPI0032D5A474
MSQINFLATKEDLLPVLSLVEAALPLRYTLTGNFEDDRIEAFTSSAQIADIGTASSPRSAGSATYLITPVSQVVNVRTIAGAGGKTRYLVDQLTNADSGILAPAGKWQEAIVAGYFSTVSDTEISKQLMKLFRSGFRKHFKKAGEFWVGPEAYAAAELGTRLTQSADSPSKFDISIQ